MPLEEEAEGEKECTFVLLTEMEEEALFIFLSPPRNLSLEAVVEVAERCIVPSSSSSSVVHFIFSSSFPLT